MPINIYSVTAHLESEGWRLLSDTYKNLNTELEMVCPRGHKQTQTYGNWRKHLVCEVCMAGDTKKVKKNSVPTKSVDTVRLLALDAATNVTGYAVYDDGTLVTYGTYRAEGQNVEARINNVKKWVARILDEWQIDFVGVEHIQLQAHNGFQNVEVYRALANLQGVLLDTLFEACVDHDLAYASEWRKYCGVGEGVGRENKKKQAQEKVKLWYNQDCTQDEADAICIGKYFVSILKKKKSSWGEDLDV